MKEYEDEMLDEPEDGSETSVTINSRKERIKSGLHFTRFVLMLIMIVAALILLFSNRDNINVDNLRRLAAKIDIGVSSVKNTDNAVIDYDYNSSAVTAVYKDGIARVTGENLVIMDNMGNQFQSVLTGFNTPALITTKKYVIAYDCGGNRLIVTNSFTVLFEKTFSDNIVSVSMNNNGYFSVITESDAYKNKLYVFSSDFREIYKISSMTRYLICADVSDDNNHIAVSSIYVKDENIIPQINYYKFNSEDAVWEHNFDDDLAIAIKIKDDGSVSALFEWGVCILDSKGNEKYRYNFENKILQAYYLGNSRHNVAVVSDSVSGNSQIHVFSDSGKTISDIDTDFNIISIDVYSDRIAVLTVNSLYVYSTSGKLLYERENKSNGMRILFSSRNAVLVVSASGAVYNLID